MSRQTVVITGANSGIGLHTALHFARAGAQVVMACRNLEKAERARDEILAAVPDASALVMPLDVSDLESGRAFASRFEREVGELDVLVHNAGVAVTPLARTGPGQELQLATNYLGAFALTGRLLPRFRPGASTRIVHVASLAHRFGRLPLDDLNWDATPYNEWKAYANSKVALMSHAMELHRRLTAVGSETIAVAAHPGFAATNIQASSPKLAPKNALHAWFQDMLRRFWVPSAAEAARPIIKAASDGVEGGDYYGPRGLLEIKGRPAKARINPLARDATVGKRLWEISEDMTGVRYLSEH